MAARVRVLSYLAECEGFTASSTANVTRMQSAFSQDSRSSGPYNKAELPVLYQR